MTNKIRRLDTKKTTNLCNAEKINIELFLRSRKVLSTKVHEMVKINLSNISCHLRRTVPSKYTCLSLMKITWLPILSFLDRVFSLMNIHESNRLWEQHSSLITNEIQTIRANLSSYYVFALMQMLPVPTLLLTEIQTSFSTKPACTTYIASSFPIRVTCERLKTLMDFRFSKVAVLWQYRVWG